MMGRRQKLIDGDEWDVVYKWPTTTMDRPGYRKAVKRRMNKRFRKMSKDELRDSYTLKWGNEGTGRYWKRRVSKLRRRAVKQGRTRGLVGAESTANYKNY